MFNGAIIAVDMSSGMKFKEKVAIRKIITDNGGYMTFTVNKECLLLVTDQPKSERCHQAFSYRIPVVSVEYLQDCVQSRYILAIEPYLLVERPKELLELMVESHNQNRNAPSLNRKVLNWLASVPSATSLVTSISSWNSVDCLSVPAVTSEVTSISGFNGIDCIPAATSQATSISVPAATSQATSIGVSAAMSQATSVSVSATTSQATSISVPAATSQAISIGVPAAMSQATSVSVPATTSQATSIGVSAAMSQATSVSVPATTSQATSINVPAAMSQATSVSVPATTSQATSICFPAAASQVTLVGVPAATSQTTSISGFNDVDVDCVRVPVATSLINVISGWNSVDCLSVTSEVTLFSCFNGDDYSFENQLNILDSAACILSADEQLEAPSLSDVTLNSSQQNSDTITRSRKKVRCSKSWKRNVRKENRAKGLSYVNSKNHQMMEKSPKGQGCSSNCRFKCTTLFTNSDRVTISKEFYGLADSRRQKDFICSTVEESDVARHRSRIGHRVKRKSRSYHLRTARGQLVRICQKFYLNTLSLTSSVVVLAMKGKRSSGSYQLDDGRKGKVPHNKSKPEDVSRVVQHINLFPRTESHYCRKDTQRLYLAPELNIKQMYRLYRDHFCSENSFSPVSENVYRNIFPTQFNLSFFKPKKDQCSLCNEYYAATEIDKLSLLENWNAHKSREIQSMEMKKLDKVTAMNDKQFRSITFDLQAVLSTPHAGDAQIYYKRKLSVYNFTIYDAASRDGFCYLWDETEGGRGSCEIGTCLLSFLNCLPIEVRHVASFSDTCGGQNRNKFVVAAMLHAVQIDENKLEVIDLKFMERGHSYLEVDSMHATIEREKKHHAIYTTREWQLLISGSRKDGAPYEVIRMDHTKFYDLKCLANTLMEKTSKNTETESIPWLKIKWMRFQRCRPNIMLYKCSLSDEVFKEVNYNKPLSSNVELTHLYNARRPITAAKKKDLMSLLNSGVIPKDYSLFYGDLPVSSAAQDALQEERDVLDPDSSDEMLPENATSLQQGPLSGRQVGCKKKKRQRQCPSKKLRKERVVIDSSISDAMSHVIPTSSLQDISQQGSLQSHRQDRFPSTRVRKLRVMMSL